MGDGPEQGVSATPRWHVRKFSEGLLDNRLILETLGVRPGWAILDAGCGNGYMSKVFARAVGPEGRVYALDKDRQFIRALDAEARGTNIQAMLGDVTGAVPLPDACLDLVYASTMVHVMTPSQLKLFAREAARLLKPGGWLAIVEIEKRELAFGPPVRQKYSPQELKEVIGLEPSDMVMVAEHFYLQVFRNQP